MKNLFSKKEMALVKKMVRSNVRGFKNLNCGRMEQYIKLAKEMVNYAMYNEYGSVDVTSIWVDGYKSNESVWLNQYINDHRALIVSNMYAQQAINAGFNMNVLGNLIKFIYDLGYVDDDKYQGFFMPSDKEVIEALK